MTMVTLPPIVMALLYILINNIICNASCPCHIPCTSSMEECTCYGPIGDDGYGCTVNGDDYSFLNQEMTVDNRWQVECKRVGSCSPESNDDSIFALISKESGHFSAAASVAATSMQLQMAWFGGNWFDILGANANANANGNGLNNEIDIDMDYSPQSAYSSSHAQPKWNEQQWNDDLGRNESGYHIIALPLYILIASILCSAIVGMLMCGGLIYCGLHCCCPLPPSSPTLTPSQRENEVGMLRLLQSFALNKRNNNGNSHDYSNHDVLYRGMGNALHNTSNSSNNDNDDDGSQWSDEKEIELKAKRIARDSDIDQDSEFDEMQRICDLVETEKRNLQSGMVTVDDDDESDDGTAKTYRSNNLP